MIDNISVFSIETIVRDLAIKKKEFKENVEYLNNNSEELLEIIKNTGINLSNELENLSNKLNQYVKLLKEI